MCIPLHSYISKEKQLDSKQLARREVFCATECTESGVTALMKSIRNVESPQTGLWRSYVGLQRAQLLQGPGLPTILDPLCA